MYVVLPVVSIWALAQWIGIFIKKPQTTACDIAEVRYAKGEITAAELQAIKKNLL
jgi:uncharacterized membrane protein